MKYIMTQFVEWRYSIIIGLMVSLFFSGISQAQDMMKESCFMCGAMGWAGMILGVLLSLAVIAVLVALAIFLIRRSRPASS